jgi:hypothetical protein
VDQSVAATPGPGDALWALMVFGGFGFLFPRASTLTAADRDPDDPPMAKTTVVKIRPLKKLKDMAL